MKKPMFLPIGSIECDMLLQPRATLHQDWIEEYAQQMTDGATFPPIVVYFDGTKYWLGDGFHRTYAAEAAGYTEIAADIRKGTRRDALLHSVSANAEHGHRRTNDDKRRAVDILLTDPDWAKWSDSEIARRCAVHHSTVAERRKAILRIPQDAPRLVVRGGTTYEMNTAPIGGTGNLVPISPQAASSDSPAPVPTFDFEASKIYRGALDSIMALAALPEPKVVIAAWMKSMSYGEPIETLEKASDWLAEFVELYREAEPRRWAAVQRARQEVTAHAAE